MCNYFPAGHLLDQYKRDSTVRIGKWRWPPPKEEASQDADGRTAQDDTTEGFLEFKMRKLQERKRSAQMPEAGDHHDTKLSAYRKKQKPSRTSAEDDGNDSLDTSGEIQGKYCDS